MTAGLTPWLSALAACLLAALSACSAPGSSEAAPPRFQSKEAYRNQARLAMVSYQAVDACLRDAANQTRIRFSNWELDQPAQDGISAKLGALLDTAVSDLSQHPAVVTLFETAAENFASRLTSVPGVSAGFDDSLQLDGNPLKIFVYTEVQGDADLVAGGMDLGGKLKPQSATSLPGELAGLGYTSGAVSGVLAPAAGRGEALLLSYTRGDGASDQVRVIGQPSGAAFSELNLRLESKAPGYSRLGLREIRPESGGTRSLLTDLSIQLSDGSQIAIAEQRFANAEGAGVGVGSFTFTGSNGASTSGALRTIASADGRLLMLLAPAESDKGPLLFREGPTASAELLTYNPLGQTIGHMALDLGSATAALSAGRSF